MTQHQSFTFSQVLAICEMVAPTATIADIRKAIATQTAQDNAPESQTRETASTAPTAETAETPSPAIVNPERNDAPKPKKPTQAELADAYNRIQAYVTHNGKTQLTVYEDVFDPIDPDRMGTFVYPTADVSERKWNAISLSIRKAVETLGGGRWSAGQALVIDPKAWRKAKKAAKKAAK